MRLDEAPRGSLTTVRSVAPRSANSRAAVWRSKRAGTLSAGRLALMRLSRSKALLLTVALGILVAVVLVCSVPLYNALVANVQLQRAIHTGGPAARNIEVHLGSQTIDSKLQAQTAPIMQGLSQQYLGKFTESTPTYYAVGGTMLVWQAGAVTYDPSLLTTLQIRPEAFDYTATGPHMHFVAGGPPQQAGAGSPPQVIITKELAADYSLKVGDPLVVAHYGDRTLRLTAKIVGIWEPNDVADPYWNEMTFAASKPQDQPPIYPVLWNLHDFFADLHQYSQQDLSQRWIYYTQPTQISIANAQAVQDDLANYHSRVSGNLLGVNGITDVAVGTDLDHTITDVEQQQSLLALPLYVVAAQIVGLALLFVAAMAGLLIEGQSQDITTLKSRGMSGLQILGIYVTQGTILGVLAAIAGPFLAAVLALSLVEHFLPGATTAFAGVGASYFSKIASPSAAIVPAVAGAMLGIGTIAFAALNAARLEVLAFRREQARPTRQPLWRRYYLDLGLVVLCLVGYYELGQFGGASTRAQLGGSGANPLLLASPALLLLAGALVVLRLVPMAAALGERVAARGRGITSVLAFAQVERNPSRYTRMTLLLVLSVGLGLFALTFDASLGQNVHDRVAYATGAEIRTTQNSAEAGVLSGRIAGQIKQLRGVQAITPVYRTQASTSLDEGDLSLEMLAIDPDTFGTVADSVSWRNDYADHSLDSLLTQMRAHLHGATAGTPSAPIWALISQSYAETQHLKVGDRFALMVAGNSFSLTSFVVGDIVPSFPTLYPQFKPGGFIIAPYGDVLADTTRETPESASTFGPNEFWLNVTSPAAQASVISALNNKASALDIASLDVLSDDLAAAQANPVSAGMRGLLLVGALTAALLAILGSIVQSVLAARQRTTQFAILRTIGMANRQITGLLLGEQVVVYLFGLIGGTVLGLLLTSATLPFLQFSDTTVDTTKLGIPPYQLIFNPHNIAFFYAALIVAFIVALVIAARYAANIGLGKALRLGED